ncbi:MAG: CsgG/HfaB family protein [Candidatus Omnitrophota bacterium]
MTIRTMIMCGCVVSLLGCAPRMVVEQVHVGAQASDQDPLSIRASDARSKKAYDYKQHYMKPESSEDGVASVSAGVMRASQRVIKPRIAVSRFGDRTAVSGNPFSSFVSETEWDRETNTRVSTNWDVEDYEGFTEDIISALAETGRFILIERTEISKILREQGFQSSSFADGTPHKDLGELTGVDYLITGSAEEDEAHNVVVNLRVYDVFRGTIVGAKRIAAPSKWEAVTRAVEHLAAEIVPKEWVLKISSVSGKTLTLNGGKADNVQSGAKYEVYAVGDRIVDPDTNAVLGVEQNKVALISVTSVYDTYSSAMIIQQTSDPRPGDIVKLYKGVYFDGASANE